MNSLSDSKSLFVGDSVFGILDYRTCYADEASSVVSSANGWNISPDGKNGFVFSHEKLGFEFTVRAENCAGGFDLYMPKSGFIEKKNNRFFSMRLFPEIFHAEEGGEGYFILPQQSGVISRFTNKADAEHRIGVYGSGISECTMPVFGTVRDDFCYSCVIASGYCDFSLILETARGPEKKYLLYPQIHFRYEFNVRRQDFPMVFEDVHFRFRRIPLEGRSGAAVMAEDYREFLLGEKRVTPLAERAKHYPELNYALGAPEIRIRLACKWPFPPVIREQTVENEPKVHVFCSFDQVREIVDACKRKGIEKACFCLVGWAAKGHDGRYPQILPVEETLGGEKKLRELISYVQSLGYRISAHDNHYDAYRISEDPIEPYLIRTQDGGPLRDGVWGGGQAYLLCPEAQYKNYTVRNLSAIRDLGFKGIHFTDCLSTTGLRVCWDEKHPLTKTQAAFWRVKILEKAKEIFGGAQCEGPFDFASGVLDRVMYVESPLGELSKRDYFDESVPLYEMVFHGILLYNVTGESINSLPGSSLYLRNLAFGGMPYFYFYRHFATKNYLPGTNTPVSGKFDTSDYTLDNLEAEAENMKQIVEDNIGHLGHLQTCFIRDFVHIAPGVTRTDYSNGESLYVNTKETPFESGKISIPAFSWTLK